MAALNKWFLLIIHLDDVDRLEDILRVFTENQISGCTIFETKGVGHTTFIENDEPLIGSLTHLLGADRQYNKTIFSVIDGQDTLDKTMLDIEKAVGDFCKPDTGIMYSIPLHGVRGYRVDKGGGKYECAD